MKLIYLFKTFKTPTRPVARYDPILLKIMFLNQILYMKFSLFEEKFKRKIQETDDISSSINLAFRTSVSIGSLMFCMISVLVS